MHKRYGLTGLAVMGLACGILLIPSLVDLSFGATRPAPKTAASQSGRSAATQPGCASQPAATQATHMDLKAIILERAKILQGFAGQQIPEATPQVLQQADQIAEGTVFFYETTPVRVGLKDIDWSGSHIKHQEWPAQLNRFFHLAPLAAAYTKTGDERYARAARAYIEDWLHGDSYATADVCRPGDRTLDMSIRLGTSQDTGWGGTLPAFLNSPSFDDAFVAEVCASLGHQAHWLSRHLTPNGNWRISQLDALVFTALRFPFLEGADELLRTGITGMGSALATQFLPDGVHIERTPGYHDWMTGVAASYLELARLMPQADARVNPDLLVRSLDYGAQAELAGINDSTAPHRDPGKLECLEKRGQTIRQLGLKGATAQPPLEQVFPAAGQVFVRSGWSPGADYLAFDACTWGGPHSHLSRLSLALRSHGRMLVADPGILNYEMSDPLAAYGKSTTAHSTLNINGWNQSGADASLLRTEFTPATALIHAAYQGGYWEGQYTWNFGKGRGRGVYGSHQRIVFWIRGEYVLVLDRMNTDGGCEVRNVWQLGPMDKAKAEADKLLWSSRNDDVNLLVAMLAGPAGTKMTVIEGCREPLAGWVGWHGNDAVAAPRIEFTYPAEQSGSLVSAVLLAPFTGKDKPAYKVRARRESSYGQLQYLAIELPDGQVDHVAWSEGLTLPVEAEPFATDATFVWLRTDSAGKPIKGHLLDGSYLRYNGQDIERHTLRN